MNSQLRVVGWIATRFLMTKSSDGFLSLITTVSIGGVALGVIALTVVLSVINGFEGELVRVISGMNGDVIVYTRGEPIAYPDQMTEKIKLMESSVVAATPAFIAPMMASGPAGSSGVVVEGVDLATVESVTRLKQSVSSGRLAETPEEVALGSVLAKKLGVAEGDSVRLVVPTLGQSSHPPKILQAKVTGIVKMGMYEYDSQFVFMTLPGVQEFTENPGKATAFKLKLKAGEDSTRVSDRLSRAFSYPLKARDWGQINRNVFYAIRLEKAVIAVILTVIIIVAAFNVVSTLMMMIHDKTQEIAILKAMGFQKRQSFGLFCAIGTGIGIVGTAIGIGLGLAICAGLSRARWIDLPADIYYIEYLPVIVRWNEVFWIAVSGVVITALATWYPSAHVSNRSPLDGLKYD